MAELSIVTGAFGYTGRYIAKELIAEGGRVRTLTNHPGDAALLGGAVEVAPLNFQRPADLVKRLLGASTLYNTYWVRFPRRGVSFQRAVDNTAVLVKAAEEAGVSRVVHVSITNAWEDSRLPYFRGKGVVERLITESQMSFAILRPTVIFGPGDILVNNIAWLLRNYPVFPVFGSGEYLIQPVFVEDLAEMAVRLGHQDGNITLDAVGPETYTYEEMVRVIARQVGSKARVVHVAPGVALFLARLLSYLVRDILVTKDEIRGLMSGLLVSEGAPTCPTKLSQWLDSNSHLLGTRYASEVARHYR